MDDKIYYEELYEKYGRFQYLRFLAFSYYAEIEVDDNGEEFCSGLSEPGSRLYLDIRNGKAVFPFVKEKYDANQDIQNSLTAMGLDSEKFWFALLYAYHAAEVWNTDCIALTPAVQEHVEPLIEALRDAGATISVQRPGKKRCVVSDPMAIGFILKMLEDGDRAYEDKPAYSWRSGRLLSRREDITVGWQMMDLYNALIRVIEYFRTDKDLPKRVKGLVGSRDKDLLVSRLLYLVKLTEDNGFTKGVNPIHALKKRCRESPRPLQHSTYELGLDADNGSDTDTDTVKASGPTLYVPR